MHRPSHTFANKGAIVKCAYMAKGKKGYVAIPRGIFESLAPERHRLSKVEAFLYLAYNVRFARAEDVLSKVPCKKGQIVTSLRKLADAFLWPEAAVRRFLFQLVANDYIVWTSYKRTTVITMKHLADDEDVTEEEKKGDANSDANSDATFDATFDATKHLNNKQLGIRTDATFDAIFDANGNANGDALARVLCYSYLVKKKEKGNTNVSSRKAGSKKEKTLVGKARDVFEEFYHDKINPNDKYYWTAADGNQMGQLLQKIRFSRSQRAMPCEEDDMLNALKALLGSIKNQWLLDHMKVGMLNSQYNEIVAAASGRRSESPSIEVGRIITEYDENKFKNKKDFFK